jgi:hypothetical protein
LLSRDPIEPVNASNYITYSEERDKILKKGFKFRCIFSNDRPIDSFVDDGYEVVTLPHYDPDGKREEGFREVYLKGLER